MISATTVDTSGLNRGIQSALVYTKRSVPEMVNTAAYWCAVNAKANTPYITATEVDAELSVVKTEVIRKGYSGIANSGKARKKKFTYRGGVNNSVTSVHDVPITVLIIAARAKQGSRYNTITSNRYALDKNPFAGVSRAQGRAAMLALERKMISSRHSSGHFLQSGWVESIRTLRPFSVQKFSKSKASPTEWSGFYHGGNFGSAIPAIMGGLWSSATITNNLGAQGKMRDKVNQALLAKGTIPLQIAVDREGKEQMNYALKKMEEEMRKEMKPHWT